MEEGNQQDPTEAFIARWQTSDASERSNAPLFLTELCDLLHLDHPHPAGGENAYLFERDVTFQKVDGSTAPGRIDLYKLGCFVLEAKQGSHDDSAKVGHGRRGTPAWEQAMIKARNQADRYIRALPPEEGRPPFLLVADVGHMIEIYAEFSRSGGTYIPFPAPGSHRIYLSDLRMDQVRERLRAIWTDPLSLDPSRRSARVTREVAEKLAQLAKSLEGSGQSPEDVAHFLMRALFTMFAEDVGLIGGFGFQPFTKLLGKMADDPSGFVPMLEELWGKMNTGGFSTAICLNLLQFNGGLFADSSAIPLTKDQIRLLSEAAECDWRDVEPAIFGTLLERALDPRERHKLGAHYTPRAYVERLVMPTVIQPLREEWDAVLAAAVKLDNDGNTKAAIKELLSFHQRLCHLRILDPACGSGNFLYVTLEHLKRIEGEVLDTLNGLGHRQSSLDMHGESVDPHQLLGLEINPRAAAIAELVLWIGTLQWHFRNRGKVMPPQPIIRDFKNIECRDALLTYDEIVPATDADGNEITQWDGHSMKLHPVTGKEVPDDSARKLVHKYINPGKAQWPEADYIIGNPPFIGTSRMRDALGDGYTDTVRKIHNDIGESSDFVMYWWNHAAESVRENKVRSFGFITTNSLRQTFNRRVIQKHLDAKDPLSISFAIPDHPWVDDGAAIRIAMTSGLPGQQSGLLQNVSSENRGDNDSYDVDLESIIGKIAADLTIGADVSSAVSLKSNLDISCPGVKLHGAGFICTTEDAAKLGLGRIEGLKKHIREYRNGKDLTNRPRGVLVIDLFGLTAEEVSQKYPEVYQWVMERVKPERDQNNRKSYRENWWVHGEPRGNFRPALDELPRYIATVETSKYRFFVFLDETILPDNKLINIASSDAFHLGVLSSKHHIYWALACKAILGPTPVYVKTICFENFPFPEAMDAQKESIRSIAEQLDAHRKRQQALHPDLTMTGMYNVLEKLRSGDPLTAKEKVIHEQGLVSVLKQIHDDLDAAVATAYDWPTDLDEQEILQRLVDLNHQRAAEEAEGNIRWLRPDYQNPQGPKEAQGELTTLRQSSGQAKNTKAVSAAVITEKQPWPTTLPEQLRAIRTLIANSPQPLTETQIAKSFTRGPKKKVAELMEVLEDLG